MEHLTKTSWGGKATVNVKELMSDPSGWRKRLYDRKILVLQGLADLSESEFWQLHTIWGEPWNAEDYASTTEHFQDIGDNKFITLR